MGRIIAKNIVKRESGYLYYVDGKGNVCEAKMARGGRRKKSSSSRKKTSTRRKSTVRRVSSQRKSTSRKRGR